MSNSANFTNFTLTQIPTINKQANNKKNNLHTKTKPKPKNKKKKKKKRETYNAKDKL